MTGGHGIEIKSVSLLADQLPVLDAPVERHSITSSARNHRATKPTPPRELLGQ